MLEEMGGRGGGGDGKEVNNGGEERLNNGDEEGFGKDGERESRGKGEKWMHMQG